VKEVTTMTQPSPDTTSVPERSTLPQDEVLITRFEQGAVRFLFATMPNALPLTLADTSPAWGT
jgi:hypothetical protein